MSSLFSNTSSILAEYKTSDRCIALINPSLNKQQSTNEFKEWTSNHEVANGTD